MKELDAYSIDPAAADVVMEMIEDLRTRLAASEEKERRLREVCDSAVDWFLEEIAAGRLFYEDCNVVFESLRGAALAQETNDA